MTEIRRQVDGQLEALEQIRRSVTVDPTTDVKRQLDALDEARRKLTADPLADIRRQPLQHCRQRQQQANTERITRCIH